MAARSPGPERKPRRPKGPRLALTTAGLQALIRCVDRLGEPDHIGPDGLALTWSEPGAVLILTPDRERCVLRDDQDEAFFELFGWCLYHRLEVDLLAPEEFDGGVGQEEGPEIRAHAVTFAHLSPEDVAAFREVVRGRGGLCLSDREFHGRDGPGEDPGGWPENTGILVVHGPVGTAPRARRAGAAPEGRTVTLFARNAEWLRTTAEALRKLVESHGAGGRNVQ